MKQPSEKERFWETKRKWIRDETGNRIDKAKLIEYKRSEVATL
jgi:hypothetical protein